MNIVDSSGWLEYFSGGPNAFFFAPAVLEVGDLIVPASCVYEVFKRLSIMRDEEDALLAIGIMSLGTEEAFYLSRLVDRHGLNVLVPDAAGTQMPIVSFTTSWSWARSGSNQKPPILT